MTNTDLPGYSGVGANRAAQMRNQQAAHQKAADALDEIRRKATETMTAALEALERNDSAADRLRAMAEKGRNAR